MFTDHKNLEYIRTAKRLNSLQARWCLLFSRFNFTLSFRPGSKNGTPDALSHNFPASSSLDEPRNILPGHCIVGAVQWDIESLVRSAQPDNAAPSQCPVNRLFVPVSLRSQVLQWGHPSHLPPQASPLAVLGPHVQSLLTHKKAA